MLDEASSRPSSTCQDQQPSSSHPVMPPPSLSHLSHLPGKVTWRGYLPLSTKHPNIPSLPPPPPCPLPSLPFPIPHSRPTENILPPPRSPPLLSTRQGASISTSTGTGISTSTSTGTGTGTSRYSSRLHQRQQQSSAYLTVPYIAVSQPRRGLWLFLFSLPLCSSHRTLLCATPSDSTLPLPTGPSLSSGVGSNSTLCVAT